ncbi:hypothetical protein B0H13DRAFT_389769 [Mycena leptocephala]|nr:hypothetical protein B0H13DRAFT_389769 [Mycena leptocephala]
MKRKTGMQLERAKERKRKDCSQHIRRYRRSLASDNDPFPTTSSRTGPSFSVQQSPFKIRTISPGSRLNVYAILQSKTVPQNVTLTGLAEDGSEIRLSVPVTLSNLPNAPDSPPAIHALAVRKIIQDHEDGQHAITTSVPDDALLLARTVKASIVRLAKTYSISSSQTSFVAVDESGTQHWQYDSPPTASPQVVRKRRNFKSLESSSGSGPGRRRMACMVTASPQYPSPWQTTDRAQLLAPDLAAITLDSGPQGSQAVQDTDWTPPESWAVPVYLDSLDELVSPRGSSLARLMAPFGPSEGGEVSALVRPAPSEHVQVAEAGLKRFRRGVANISQSQEAEPSIDPLETLARLQSFDGCFGQAVLSTVRLNIAADEARAALGVSEKVFATVIAMAFLCTKLGPDVERESWEAIYDKARAFVEDALQNVVGTIAVDELQAQAVGFLV